MYRQQNYSQDDAAATQLADRLTGGKWSLMRHIFQALLTAHANLIGVFFRKKAGIQNYSAGKFFWMAAWLGLSLLVFWENGKPMLVYVAGNSFDLSSWNLLFLHIKFAMILYVVKWIIAYMSIGSHRAFWFRQRDAAGSSILWPIVAFFLRPLRLASETPRFYQMSQRRFMIWVEPLIVMGMALFFYVSYLTAYGNFLLLGSFTLGFSTFRAMKRKDLAGQIAREAEIMA